LNEVCRIVAGQPKCACPLNYERATTKNNASSTAACTVINECQFPQLNDCHPRLGRYFSIFFYFISHVIVLNAKI